MPRAKKSETQKVLEATQEKPAKKAPAKKDVTIHVPKPKIEYVELPVVGTQILGVHQWAEKSRKEIRDKQMQKPKDKKGARNPFEEFLASMYTDPPMCGLTPEQRQIGLKMSDEEFKREYIIPGSPNARYFFPLIGFKKALVRACTQTDSLKMTFARGAFHVMPDKDIYIEIFGVPYMREDMVRIGQGTADLRYRGFFPTWCAKVRIKFLANSISADQVANLLHTAGFSVGIGEWRPEKDGFCGTFEVVDHDRYDEVKAEIDEEWKLAAKQWERWIDGKDIPLGGRIAA